jgi:nucleotide-binding universal stress UspA family protein
MFQTVVVGVDGSHTSSPVIEAAARLSASTGAELILVHAAELAPGRLAPHHEPTKVGAEILTDAEAVVKGLGGKVTKLVDEEVGLKGPAGVIDDVAVKHNADLIVVGTRGHDVWSGSVLGSVSQRLLHSPPCPVLVIPNHA